MFRQSCVIHPGILQTGVRRPANCTGVKFSSTFTIKAEDSEVQQAIRNDSKATNFKSKPRTQTTPTTNSASLTNLESALGKWDLEAGRSANKLVKVSSWTSHSKQWKKFKPVAGDNAEGEFCVVKQTKSYRILRRLPGTNNRFQRTELTSPENGELYVVHLGRDEKRFVPLPSKGAAEAIREVKRRDAVKIYGTLERRLSEFRKSQSTSISGTSRAFSTSIHSRAEPASIDLLRSEIDPQTNPPQPNALMQIKEEVPLDIRQQLKAWDIAHPEIKPKAFKEGTVSMHTQIETLRWDMLQADEQHRLRGEGENQLDESEDMLFKKDEIVDFGDRRSFLVRGDMVELDHGSESELAIYIQNRGDVYGFYTLSGRWLQLAQVNSNFSVPNFVEPEMLHPILRFISDADVSKEDIPRHIGTSLIQEMQTFSEQSNRFYRANASEFDRAHETCALETNKRHATLLELADEIIPENLKYQGKYPTSLLYALFRVLDADTVGFRTENFSRDAHAQFTIYSLEEVNTINFVRDEVRADLNSRISAGNSVAVEKLSLMQFVSKAQILIDQSRKFRDITPHGSLGPLKPQTDADDAIATGASFTHLDWQYIRFLESWSCRRSFNSESRDSAIASVILGATERYSGMELNQSTGWTLLQELGVVSPFANPALSVLNLPLGKGFLFDEIRIEKPFDIVPDVLDGLRKDWGNLPVYCIDDIGAREIDDGISIEIGEQPGEYWVHIHTANPGSQIFPESELSRRAEALASTMYLPETVISMLPESLVQEKFSLAPGRPSITYSARLDAQGAILEQRVIPGTVRNVLFLTPDTVEEVVQGYAAVTSESKTITVGNDETITNVPEVRPIVSMAQLSLQDMENVKLLYKLALAREKRSMQRGAFTEDMRANLFGNHQSQKPIHVSTRFMSKKPPTSINLLVEPDPLIKLHLHSVNLSTSSAREKSDCLVKNLMLLGGEVAGKWCQKRNIPLMYRVSQRNDDLVDPADYYRREIRPRLKVSGEIPREILRAYLALLGSIQPSSTAGPHLALGMEMFARSTSPLRRYSDLLLQWQVQAGLLEEARLGASLVGSNREDYLPFKKSRMDQLIIQLKAREFDLRIATGMAEQFWCIQFLIRAWKFQEATLPKTFEFTVKRFQRTHMLGYLTHFGGLVVRSHYPKWMRPEDMKVGDLFEVEIADLNSYTCRIYMQPLRAIKVA